jgi:hypothetical protein
LEAEIRRIMGGSGGSWDFSLGKWFRKPISKITRAKYTRGVAPLALQVLRPKFKAQPHQKTKTKTKTKTKQNL